MQLGSFSIVGIPLFKAMAELFEDAQPMLDGVLANYHHWEAATPDTAFPLSDAEAAKPWPASQSSE